MIFQGNFQYFDIWDAVESGLYYAIVGFYFLIFAYFFLMRFRTSKKFYWLYFSLLFLCLAAGRVFFITYYFYIPELLGTMPNLELVGLLNILYRLATFSTWLGIACLMGVFGTLIFPSFTEEIKPSEKEDLKFKVKMFLRKNHVRITFKILLILFPIVIGILALTLPDSLFMDPDFNKAPYNVGIELITILGYPAGRFVLNFIFLPLMVIVIPILFVYLALKTFGVLRKSYALNACGFFIYFIGRIAQGLLDTVGFYHVRALLPPLLILLSLLIIVIGNHYEQLK